MTELHRWLLESFSFSSLYEEIDYTKLLVICFSFVYHFRDVVRSPSSYNPELYQQRRERMMDLLPRCLYFSTSFFILHNKVFFPYHLETTITNCNHLFHHYNHHIHTIPRSQKELPARRMADSFDSAAIPLGSDPQLRDRFANRTFCTKELCEP